MSHVAVPHWVDALGFLVGGAGVSLAFILRMVLHDADHLAASALLLAAGSVLMLLFSEPFVTSARVVMFYRVVAIGLAATLEVCIVAWVLFGEQLRPLLFPDHRPHP